MSGEIVDLDAHRPHVVIHCEGHSHVASVAWLEAHASGRTQGQEPLPACLLGVIIREWLEQIPWGAA